MNALIGLNPHLDQFEDDSSGNIDSFFDIPSKENMVLLPGDCIWYFSPGGIFGNKTAFRETIILSVNPEDVDGFSLKLQNNESIPDTTKIRRVYQMPYTSEQDNNFIMDHANAYNSDATAGVPQCPSFWQPVANFVLHKVPQPETLKSLLQTESQRISEILVRNREICEEKAKADGTRHFMDMVVGKASSQIVEENDRSKNEQHDNAMASGSGNLRDTVVGTAKGNDVEKETTCLKIQGHLNNSLQNFFELAQSPDHSMTIAHGESVFAFVKVC